MASEVPSWKDGCMTEEEKAEVAAPDTAAAAEQAPKAKKKGKKKWPIIVGVVVAVVVVAGAGFWVWHEQPSFCNAICHTPMDAYLPTYEAEVDMASTDKWGNEVTNASAMMAPLHRAQNGDTCLSCHVPTLSEQISEGMSWISGNYEVWHTQTGLMVPPERTLAELTEARGIPADEFCLNEACHNMTRDDLAKATSDMKRNPHVAQHGTVECSECHKAHRASVNYCSSCHNDAEIPDGWITAAENKTLLKQVQEGE